MCALLFKKIRPTTPCKRNLKMLVLDFLCNRKKLKKKTFFLKPSSGRNHKGIVTVAHKGGAQKKLYRNIDFKRIHTTGIVENIEYDPYRNTFIARLFEEKKNKRDFILAPKNISKGAYIRSGKNGELKVGHSSPLNRLPVGSVVHNITFDQKKGGQYARSAGTKGQILEKIKDKGYIRLPSGKHKYFFLNTCASLGRVSNENYKLCTLGKAGRSRWIGRRPHVRGVAMNPIDHPHGGGEGKTSGGRPSVTPWAKPARGQKTSRSKTFKKVSKKNK